MKNLIKKILREEIEDDGFDWIRDMTFVTEWDMDKNYVIDVSGLYGSQKWNAVEDIMNEAERMGYEFDFTEVDTTYACYIFLEKTDYVDEGIWLDWAGCDYKPHEYQGQYVSWGNFKMLFNL